MSTETCEWDNTKAYNHPNGKVYEMGKSLMPCRFCISKDGEGACVGHLNNIQHGYHAFSVMRMCKNAYLKRVIKGAVTPSRLHLLR